ncbi:hypothetical protein PHYBLDRAFT_174002 [Phycomyces blakesleeanus NRRL 1555(-)]|uniref:Uncharacterized protein n=1 Tax=Phycomyces blakesleeanus (strain ATCC 8743b / DSM 1359 / FGSC 10004 / NBRC 33097 / NRRL 1555) TaxID=763407 RepID=A0A167KBB4_PHYB8|nr:hypothetical protein PHYBLDRAFT_174002 [Phycomyces blakesleeanus NRRL 1555(-)]OAD67675.1 hypothetical protein PHYBLDRAFT_174002 [Phycomyces blakesleeanus NRRL 1555(-)]|eukprot:XP_018285715.1 hypothetical protein PHYBLDRAFT_174002 [Phycomyces blakesleeanus NRRL 1555(-)]
MKAANEVLRRRGRLLDEYIFGTVKMQFNLYVIYILYEIDDDFVMLISCCGHLNISIYEYKASIPTTTIKSYAKSIDIIYLSFKKKVCFNLICTFTYINPSIFLFPVYLIYSHEDCFMLYMSDDIIKLRLSKDQLPDKSQLKQAGVKKLKAWLTLWSANH